jgi:hypothetical protein
VTAYLNGGPWTLVGMLRPKATSALTIRSSRRRWRTPRRSGRRSGSKSGGYGWQPFTLHVRFSNRPFGVKRFQTIGVR